MVTINNIRYANDPVLLAYNICKLRKFLNIPVSTCTKYGLKLNM